MVLFRQIFVISLKLVLKNNKVCGGVMEELQIYQSELQAELTDAIKREEVLISVLSTLSKREAADIEGDLREIRKERMELVHKLSNVTNKLKMMS